MDLQMRKALKEAILKGILELWMPWIRRRFALTSIQETKILRIGARTIDRYLASKKRDLRKRLYGRTKPGTLLRHQIPIKCESWDEVAAGHLELDTVSHSGECASGTFAYTLNLTDIASTWVETRSVLGKGEVAILDAFRQMKASLPFPVLSIDSDNGGEFINNRLFEYCQNERIGFTRSRPYKKDDNAHIEQKNWTHVRKIIGWDRYDTPEAVRAMNNFLLRRCSVGPSHAGSLAAAVLGPRLRIAVDQGIGSGGDDFLGGRTPVDLVVDLRLPGSVSRSIGCSERDGSGDGLHLSVVPVIGADFGHVVGTVLRYLGRRAVPTLDAAVVAVLPELHGFLARGTTDECEFLVGCRRHDIIANRSMECGGGGGACANL